MSWTDRRDWLCFRPGVGRDLVGLWTNSIASTYRNDEARIAALAFFVSIAFIPGALGAATVPRWAAFALLPVIIEIKPRWTMATVLGTCFLAWCIVLMFWSMNPVDSIGQMIQFGLMACAFIVGSQLITLRKTYAAMAIGLWVNAGFVVVQKFIDPNIVWPSNLNGAPPGLFINVNTSAEITALVFVACLATRQYWFSVPLVATLVLSHSRGAWLAVLAAFFVSPLPRLVKISVLAFGALVVMMEPQHLLEGPSTLERIAIYKDVYAGLSWFGTGIGSFQTAFPYHATHIDTFVSWLEHAHSEPLEMVYELGIGASLFFALAIICIVSANAPERMVLVAFAAEALVDFPLHLPATAFLASLVAGHACKALPDLRGVLYRGRGALYGFANTNRAHVGFAAGESLRRGVSVRTKIQDIVRAQARWPDAKRRG